MKYLVIVFLGLIFIIFKHISYLFWVIWNFKVNWAKFNIHRYKQSCLYHGNDYESHDPDPKVISELHNESYYNSLNRWINLKLKE